MNNSDSTLAATQDQESLVSDMAHVVKIDMVKAGFGEQYKAMCPGFLRAFVEDDPNLVKVNPNYRFDNVDVMRMMQQCWAREWERDEHTHRKGIFFSGPSGSGKTSFPEQFFARLNVPLVRTTWNPKRETEELIQTQTLVDGDLLPKDQAIMIAARMGYPLLINEMNLADPGEAMALTDVIEKGLITLPSGQTFQAKRGFMVFVAANTNGGDDDTGLYHGSVAQSRAFRRRFFHVHMGYPTKDAELALLQHTFPNAQPGLLEGAANVAERIRQACDGTADRERLNADFSRPELLDWVDSMFRFSKLKDRGVNVAIFAMDYVYSAGLSESDRMTVHAIVENHFKMDDAA